MKIVVDNKIPFLKGRLEPLGDVVYMDPASFTPEIVSDADAIVIRTRTHAGEELLGGSGVSLVATATIGTDHIDIPWCESHGIAVENAAGCNAPGVAQWVWSSLLRNGFDPSRHTLGVVGKGNVGSIVADWGRRMGVRVIVCDPPRARRGLTDEAYLPLEAVLREADAVTLHTPLMRDGEDATYHLIGDRELQILSPGAMLLNAARGEVVDNSALRSFLASAGEDGKPIKTFLDVWEGEPSIDRTLLGLVTVGTPHIAGYSREGKERATRMAIEAIERHFGVEVDKKGLEGDYRAPAGEVTGERITESYDPDADTRMLRENPGGFEALRGDYNYRYEPSFDVVKGCESD